MLCSCFARDVVCLLLQLEAAAKGRGDEVESEQAASGAIERRAGHASVSASLRAEYPQQAGSTQHPQTQRKLPPHQELLSR